MRTECPAEGAPEPPAGGPAAEGPPEPPAGGPAAEGPPEPPVEAGHVQLADVEECVICLSEVRRPTSAGCRHSFCRDCIFTWVTQSRAFCPVCENPIATIPRAKSNEYLLEPHAGTFGIDIASYRPGGQAFVTEVEQGSSSARAGLPVGAAISVAGERSVKRVGEALRAALDARRMVCVRVDPAAPTREEEERRARNAEAPDCCHLS